MKQQWNAFWNGKRFLCLQKIVHAGLGLLFLLLMLLPYFSVTVGTTTLRFNFYNAFTFATIFTIIWLALSLANFALPFFKLDKFEKVIRIIQFVLLLLLVLISLLIGLSQGYSYGLSFFFTLIFFAIFSIYLFRKSLIEGLIGKLIPASLLPKKVAPVETRAPEVVVEEPKIEPEPVKEAVVEPEPVKEEIVPEPEPVQEEIAPEIVEPVEEAVPDIVEEETAPIEEKKVE